MHFEVFVTATEAAIREKQIKGWKRNRKVALIQADNPRWHDLSLDLGHLLRLD
ncbi:MAG TPA: hypothetical protein VMS98_11850 [Thermoanaerobaculia bacterium]|nr:hypothetical protein [Thermoanaerobaculia bacterium]